METLRAAAPIPPSESAARFDARLAIAACASSIGTLFPGMGPSIPVGRGQENSLAGFSVASGITGCARCWS
jgi:hypothetical protein